MEGELRCPSRIQGVMTSSGLLEVKCRSKACGAKKGVVVLHYFNLHGNTLTPVKTTVLNDLLALHEEEMLNKENTQCP